MKQSNTITIIKYDFYQFNEELVNVELSEN